MTDRQDDKVWLCISHYEDVPDPLPLIERIILAPDADRALAVFTEMAAEEQWDNLVTLYSATAAAVVYPQLFALAKRAPIERDRR